MSSTVIQVEKAEVRFGAKPAAGSPIVPASLTDFSCQVTKAEITSTSNTTTSTIPATFCGPSSELSVPVASTFQLALDLLQDWTVANGLSAYLFKNDATEQAFALYLNGADEPCAMGVVVVQAGGFGGTPGEPLVATVTLNIQGYPIINDPSGAPIRPPAATGATAGTPGTWTPAGAAAPASPGQMGGIVASPATAWTVGQFVQTGTAGTPGQVHWTGSAWVSGAALSAQAAEAGTEEYEDASA